MSKIVQLFPNKPIKLRIVGSNNFTAIIRNNNSIKSTFAGKDNMCLLELTKPKPKSSTVTSIDKYKQFVQPSL